jgi:hypothetical protein
MHAQFTLKYLGMVLIFCSSFNACEVETGKT